MYKFEDQFYRSVSSSIPGQNSRIVASYESNPQIIRLTLNRVSLQDAGNYATIVTNLDGYQFQRLNLEVRPAMNFPIALNDAQKFNQLISIIVGCICIVLSVMTIVLLCLLCLKRQQHHLEHEKTSSKVDKNLKLKHKNLNNIIQPLVTNSVNSRDCSRSEFQKNFINSNCFDVRSNGKQILLNSNLTTISSSTNQFNSIDDLNQFKSNDDFRVVIEKPTIISKDRNNSLS